MTLICLRGLSLTGFTAALGSLLRRRNYLGFNVLPITVLKFLTILPLTGCSASKVQWQQRKCWGMGASLTMWSIPPGRETPCYPVCSPAPAQWPLPSALAGVRAQLRKVGEVHTPIHWAGAEAQCLWGAGEGNGNPLQCSCLENPRDGGAWWAAVSGVTVRHDWSDLAAAALT